MIARNRVLLRLPNGRPDRPVSIDRSALTAEIVAGTAVPPDAELLVGGRWHAVRHCPDAPWLGELARRAIAAAEAFDARRTAEWIDRIQTYAGPHQREPIGVAAFLKAHLCLCDGNVREAIGLLEPAAEQPSLVRAAAHNNLGVAWAYECNPRAAYLELMAAADADPILPVAPWNLRVLAARMLAERAPDLAGQPRWSNVLQDAQSRLKKIPVAEIRAYASGRRPFPGFQVLHVLAIPRSFPYLSAGLPRCPTAEPAARRLLRQAHEALSDGDHPQASLLADQAAATCPTVAPEARELAASARAKMEEAGSLERAEGYARQLTTASRGGRDLGATGRRKAAELADHLAQGQFQAAHDDLRTLSAAEPQPDLAAELNTQIDVVRLIEQSRAALEAGDDRTAWHCLRQAVRHDPRNRTALELLLSIDVLVRRVAGPQRKNLAAQGRAAIDAFLAGDPAACRAACAAVRRVLPASRLVRCLQDELHPETAVAQ